MNNTFSCIGHLGKEAEQFNHKESHGIRFPVATAIGYGDKQQTLWLQCSCWKNLTKLKDASVTQSNLNQASPPEPSTSKTAPATNDSDDMPF